MRRVRREHLRLGGERGGAEQKRGQAVPQRGGRKSHVGSLSAAPGPRAEGGLADRVDRALRMQPRWASAAPIDARAAALRRFKARKDRCFRLLLRVVTEAGDAAACRPDVQFVTHGKIVDRIVVPEYQRVLDAPRDLSHVPQGNFP